MFVVTTKLKVLSRREQGAGIQSRRTPFFILLRVVRFSRNVWNEVIGENGNSAFNCCLIPISPGESSALPIKVRPVSIDKEKSSFEWKVSRKHRLHAIDLRGLRRSEGAISDIQDQGPCLRIVQIERSDVLQFN